MGWMRSTKSRVALFGVVALLATGCTPLTFLPGSGGAGTGTCLPGTWNLDSEQITSALTASLPGLVITSADLGVSLTFTDTTWALHADQTLSGSLTTTFGTASGKVDVTGDAHGTYTSTSTAVAFTLAGLSGSAAYDVNAFGSHFTGVLSLPTSGFQRLYGLTGIASSSCSSTGLSLTFPSFHMHAKH